MRRIPSPKHFAMDECANFEMTTLDQTACAERVAVADPEVNSRSALQLQVARAPKEEGTEALLRGLPSWDEQV